MGSLKISIISRCLTYGTFRLKVDEVGYILLTQDFLIEEMFNRTNFPDLIQNVTGFNLTMVAL